MMTSQWSTSALALTHFILVILCATNDVSQAMPAKQNLEQPSGSSLGDEGVLGLLPDSDSGLDGGHNKLKRSVGETQASAFANELDRIRYIRNIVKTLGPDDVQKVVSALTVIREFLLRQKTVMERPQTPRASLLRDQTGRRQQRNYPGSDFKEEVRRMGPEFNPTGW